MSCSSLWRGHRRGRDGAKRKVCGVPCQRKTTNLKKEEDLQVNRLFTQSRWDYVMIADSGHRPLHWCCRLPGDYLSPLGSRRGLSPQESVDGSAGHSLLTASPYKCGSHGAQAYCAGGRPGVSGGLVPTESPSARWH